MINNGMSDPAILKDLGQRLQAIRLDRNITQQELADRAGLSRPTVSDFERGQPATLQTLIRILRVLDLLAELNTFLPAPLPSPLELAKQGGRRRQRASGEDARDENQKDPEEDPTW